MFVIIDGGLVECINQFGRVPYIINYLLLGLSTTPFEMYGAERASKVHYRMYRVKGKNKQTPKNKTTHKNQARWRRSKRSNIVHRLTHSPSLML